MEEKIQGIKQEYLEKINSASTLNQLDQIFLELFGKNGVVTILPKKFPKLNREILTKIGPLFNSAKEELEKRIDSRRLEIREKGYEQLKTESLKLETTKIKPRKGHIHPITQFTGETVELFEKLGFQRFDAPHIDTDRDNFEVLNIPAEHPARDLWDTLYIDAEKSEFKPGQLLLRTHTSNSQIHIMENFKPPIRLMNIGRCFRYENLDARHEHTFDQFELVYIDKGLNMANLQYLSEYFLQSVFGKEIKVRMRPKYYPFVEPGVGVDGLCIFCKGKGCQVCGGVGWLELAGAGMIHPKVLQNGRIDPNIYSGIAWGMGPGRMAMLKYGISDLRIFSSGDLKELYK